ncbi:MerR family transcriptional regulator [Streptacidiphilus pinicola]|uniref:MerR family transcriptional regulator n=1 Tax=Streptacidiphilus pinicola TaxID=2219663 RepID=A0A2X0INS1_9ACTN|nr:MerR family transcriptional regulator [Streptacidiphilus pinicola]RAG86834.1 MerR family transcriptional regulator [Streptacidiphilus pinicola]
MTATAEEDRYLGIAEVAESTGLTQDTLRWYEREGLFPRVERDTSRRRRYSPRHIRVLQMLVRLRRTGMPTAEVREFTRLLGEGAVTHGHRLALLSAHRERIVARMAELREDLAVLDDKVAQYRHLIAQGLDCDGQPARLDPDAVAELRTEDLRGQ